jgi:hypothetical protein
MLTGASKWMLFLMRRSSGTLSLVTRPCHSLAPIQKLSKPSNKSNNLPVPRSFSMSRTHSFPIPDMLIPKRFGIISPESTSPKDLEHFLLCTTASFPWSNRRTNQCRHGLPLFTMLLLNLKPPISRSKTSIL